LKRFRFRLSTLILLVVIAALSITVVSQERQYGIRTAEILYMLAVSRSRADALEAQAAAREIYHERRFADHLADDRARAERRANAGRSLNPASDDSAEKPKENLKGVK
jgi:hypothetical protein